MSTHIFSYNLIIYAATARLHRAQADLYNFEENFKHSKIAAKVEATIFNFTFSKYLILVFQTSKCFCCIPYPLEHTRRKSHCGSKSRKGWAIPFGINFKMAANMASNITYFWWQRLQNSSVVVLAHETIRADTTMAGVRLLQAQLCHFEDSSMMADKMAAKIFYI